MIIKYRIEVCSICYKQASRSYTGDPHLVCEHASGDREEKIKILRIKLKFSATNQGFKFVEFVD